MYLVAGVFKGHSFILRIMSMLDIIIGRQSKSYANDNDKRRVARQERRSMSETKEARKTRREQLLMENEFYEEAEGLFYDPGIAEPVSQCNHIVFTFQNFERVFLKTLFSKLAYKIAKKLFNQSSSNCSYN